MHVCAINIDSHCLGCRVPQALALFCYYLRRLYSGNLVALIKEYKQNWTLLLSLGKSWDPNMSIYMSGAQNSKSYELTLMHFSRALRKQEKWLSFIFIYQNRTKVEEIAEQVRQRRPTHFLFSYTHLCFRLRFYCHGDRTKNIWEKTKEGCHRRVN